MAVLLEPVRARHCHGRKPLCAFVEGEAAGRWGRSPWMRLTIPLEWVLCPSPLHSHGHSPDKLPSSVTCIKMLPIFHTLQAPAPPHSTSSFSTGLLNDKSKLSTSSLKARQRILLSSWEPPWATPPASPTATSHPEAACVSKTQLFCSFFRLSFVWPLFLEGWTDSQAQGPQRLMHSGLWSPKGVHRQSRVRTSLLFGPFL